MKKQISLLALFFFFSSFVVGPAFSADGAKNFTSEQAAELQGKISKDFLTMADEVRGFSREEVAEHISKIEKQIDTYVEKGEMNEKDGARVKESLAGYKGKEGEELSKYYKDSANSFQTLNLKDFVSTLSALMIIGGAGLFCLILSATHGHTNAVGNKIILGCIGSVIGGILIQALIN